MLLLFSFFNPLKRIEKFETEEELTIDKYYYTALILYIIVLLIVAFGAAKLSYTYNNFIGTSGGLKTFYAVIAFLLSEFYYPYYAYFVDPLPALKRRV